MDYSFKQDGEIWSCLPLPVGFWQDLSVYGAFQRECPLSCQGREVCTISEPQGGTHGVRYLGSVLCQGQGSCWLHSSQERKSPACVSQRGCSVKVLAAANTNLELLEIEQEHKSLAPAARCCLELCWQKGARQALMQHPWDSAEGHQHPPSVWAEVTAWAPCPWSEGKSSCLLLTLIDALKNYQQASWKWMTKGTEPNIWHYLQYLYSLSEWACTQLLPQLVQKYLGRRFIISDLRYVSYQSHFFSKKY